MRVLVTGGSGVLGGATRRVLAAAGDDVVTAGRADGCDVTADLTTPGAADRLLSDVAPDAVVHLAWVGERRVDNPANLDWVGHTAALLRACVEHDIARVVTAGTCFEYGVARESGPAEVPATLYGGAKLAVASMLRGLVASGRLGGFHARIYYVYGPGEDEPRLLPAVGRGLLRGEVVETTDGHQTRDYLYVDDIAAALRVLLRADDSGVVDVAGGVATPVADLIDGLAARIPTGSVARGALARRPGDPDTIVGDPERLHALGWRPTVDLDDGLDRAVQWLRETQQANLQNQETGA